MARVIDIEEKKERIKIDFPYERELVDVVRTLPDRWFDRTSKCWFVPLQHLNYVIDRLDGYHFKFSPRLRRFRADGDHDQQVKPAVPEVPEGTWTISRLNQAARMALQKRFDAPVWIVGELQDFDKNRASRYRTFFFDLVERPFAGATEVAKLKAVLFERHRNKIFKKLGDNNLELGDGMAVRLSGKVDLYARNGRYQIIVEDIDPAYTAGEIELNRERVFQALKKKGIEADNRRRPWPDCPLRVGLITSFESDAYNDFVHQLRESGRGFSIAAHDANVQGVHTERSVLRALKYFETNADDFDVVAIIRGGGSRSELAYFDTEAIGEAVCRHPLKIVCGVGHQRDICLLDLIAESTKTPTAAAEQVVRRVDGFVDDLHQTYESIARLGAKKVADCRQGLVRQGASLERQVISKLGVERQRQERMEAAVGEVGRRLLQRQRRVVDDAQRALYRSGQRCAERRRRAVDRATRELSMRRLSRRFERRRQALENLVEELRKSTRRDTNFARQRLEFLEEQLTLVDPRRILERGFAVVRDERGVIRSRDQIAVGHDFDVLLGDGVLRARRVDDEQPQQQQASGDAALAESVD